MGLNRLGVNKEWFYLEDKELDIESGVVTVNVIISDR